MIRVDHDMMSHESRGIELNTFWHYILQTPQVNFSWVAHSQLQGCPQSNEVSKGCTSVLGYSIEQGRN